MKRNPIFLTKKLTSRREKFTWWQGTLFLIAISIIGRLATGDPEESREQYEEEKTPPWSPPSWLFGVAWPINNIFLTWAGIRLLNARKRFPNRDSLLQLQGMHWLIFITFGWAYFRKRSPWLAALWTQADALVALQSYRLAREGDAKLARAYLPLNAWTWFAFTIAWYQALYNPDPLLDTSAPLKKSRKKKRTLKFWE
uniref:Tryptophan-rich sensory protein n=1 Tax=Roseihalotalea indica TaxID=2867963 RepID=A0AA49GRY5_9BACT|nr:tryptophan-rich sensory protein [Tunicatimonas sp. TK19036]